MIPAKIEKAFTDHMNIEFYSEYFYLGMAAFCAENGMPGFENWFKIQAQEEHAHGMKFFDYIHTRNGKVALKAIQEPEGGFKDIIDIFTRALAHEEKVTAAINKLMDIAMAESDHSARGFLDWFVAEQDEEEETFGEILDRVKLINGEGHGMLMLDAELAKRVFTPPAAGA